MRLLLFIPILLLTSCSLMDKLQERKEKRRVENAVETLKRYDALDSLCAEEFPSDTVTTVKRDTVEITDTITQDSHVDTLTINDTVYITNWKDRVITKTIRDSVTITIPIGGAEIAHLKDQIKEKDKRIKEQDVAITELSRQYNEAQSKNKTRLWMFIAACALILLLLFLLIKRK